MIDLEEQRGACMMLRILCPYWRATSFHNFVCPSSCCTHDTHFSSDRCRLRGSWMPSSMPCALSRLLAWRSGEARDGPRALAAPPGAVSRRRRRSLRVRSSSYLQPHGRRPRACAPHACMGYSYTQLHALNAALGRLWSQRHWIALAPQISNGRGSSLCSAHGLGHAEADCSVLRPI